MQDEMAWPPRRIAGSKRSLGALLDDEDTLDSEVEEGEIVEDEEVVVGSPNATIGGINVAERTKATQAKVGATATPTCATNSNNVAVGPSVKATKAKENGAASKAFVTTILEA